MIEEPIAVCERTEHHESIVLSQSPRKTPQPRLPAEPLSQAPRKTTLQLPLLCRESMTHHNFPRVQSWERFFRERGRPCLPAVADNEVTLETSDEVFES